MKYAIFAICLLLVFAACTQQAQQEQVIDEPDEPEAQDEPEMQPEEPQIEPEPEVEPEPVKEINADVQAMIDKANEKVKSLSFVYVGPPENLPVNTYTIKGDMMVVELLQATDSKLSQTFTHVYMQGNSAKTYCNVNEMDRCPDGVKYHGITDPAEYAVMTPMDWLDAIVTAESLGNGPMYEKQQTTKVKFTTADASGEMYVMDFYALPGKVILDDGSEIEFRDLSVNSVKDEDVAEPKL
ncbi:hypothetical protein ACFL1B_03320 [Nanoarchaeota archaeon]